MRTTYITRTAVLLMTTLFILGKAFANPKEITDKKEVVKWAVQKTSTLRINGKTNITGFGCDIQGYYQTDTIYYAKDENRNRIVPLKGALNIDINNFDCHNKMLTSDLRKTLKVKEYPNLVVRFVALERMPVFESNKDMVNGFVDVTLAGVTKRFIITYTLEKTGSVIQLNGARSFSFADFKLVPPQKLGGLVKVKDDFDVDFKLVLNQVM